jgi:hypothetical protein
MPERSLALPRGVARTGSRWSRSSDVCAEVEDVAVACVAEGQAVRRYRRLSRRGQTKFGGDCECDEFGGGPDTQLASIVAGAELIALTEPG